MRFEDAVFVIVSYHTYGWIQQCINSLVAHVPDSQILVIDNNPSSQDAPARQQSFVNVKYKDRTFNWDRFCEAERDWLHRHPNVTVRQTPKRLEHGKAVDLALQWCLSRGIERMVHLEPDCLVEGLCWLENLHASMDKGMWMASGYRCRSRNLHPCPSIWLVEKACKISFAPIHHKRDQQEREFSLLFDIDEAIAYQRKWWDTGMKAWYEFAKLGKAEYIWAPDLRHYWQGACKKHWRRLDLVL